jgi:sulfur-oxidizing protein SoxB
VAEGAAGDPVWNIVARYLREKKTIRAVSPNRPELDGMKGNPGISADG